LCLEFVVVCLEFGLGVIEMNIEVGKAYRTRSGLKAVISSTHEGGYYPFMGDVHGFENGATAWHSWMRNGTWRIKDTNELDLIAEWQEPEPELKIEAGKFYKLRNGKKARVDATDYNGSFPIHGCLIPSMDFLVWTDQGKRSELQRDDQLDIIGPWIDPPKPLEHWSNIYAEHNGRFRVSGRHDTKESAIKAANNAGVASIPIRTSKFIEVLPQ